MALTLTKGTNTYATLAEAESYMESRYDPTGLWDSAEDTTKNKLLAHATKIIDQEPWRGSKTDDDQSLEFPRDGDDDVETAVTYACVEQAYYLLVANPDQRIHAQAQGVRSATIGTLSESFAGGGASALCPAARKWLRAWLITSAVIV